MDYIWKIRKTMSHLCTTYFQLSNGFELSHRSIRLIIRPIECKFFPSTTKDKVQGVFFILFHEFSTDMVLSNR